jgi:alpha-beta hydrolase superfamily lysophospholipase
MLPAYPVEAEARHDDGFLNSADHLRLYWQRYTPKGARATVLVLHGGGDHSGRYPALTTALVRAGFQVAFLDFRGHGQSDGRRWHVDLFADYLHDVDAFVAKLSQDGIAGESLFVLGHSQGGLIAALWAMNRGSVLSGLVLSAPWFRLARPPHPLKLLAAKVIGTFAPGMPLDAGLDLSQLTSDPEMQRWTARDPLYRRKATPRWFHEASRAQREALRRAAELRAPLLVLAPGADSIADAGAARAFFDATAATDKKLVAFEGFRHELFNEARREEPIGEVVAWLSARVR